MYTAALTAQMDSELGNKGPSGVIYLSWTAGENEPEHPVENVTGELASML